MIDTKKVQLMTRVASYEKNKGSRDIKMYHYRKTSYLALKLLETWICTTLVLGMIYVLYAAYLVMSGIDQGWRADYLSIGKTVVILYFLILMVASIASLYRHNKKYLAMQSSIAQYDKDLLELQKYFDDVKETVIYGESEIPEETSEENNRKE